MNARLHRRTCALNDRTLGTTTHMDRKEIQAIADGFNEEFMRTVGALARSEGIPSFRMPTVAACLVMSSASSPSTCAAASSRTAWRACAARRATTTWSSRSAAAPRAVSIMWVIAAGTPTTLLTKLRMVPAGDWPTGVYWFGEDVLRIGLVAARELPRDRTTYWSA